MRQTQRVTTRTLVFGVLVLVGVVMAVQALARGGSGGNEDPRGPRWQAMALTQSMNRTSNSEIARRINQAGHDGWELVSVEGIMEDGTTTHTVYYFKKRLF